MFLVERFSLECSEACSVRYPHRANFNSDEVINRKHVGFCMIKYQYFSDLLLGASWKSVLVPLGSPLSLPLSVPFSLSVFLSVLLPLSLPLHHLLYHHKCYITKCGGDKSPRSSCLYVWRPLPTFTWRPILLSHIWVLLVTMKDTNYRSSLQEQITDNKSLHISIDFSLSLSLVPPLLPPSFSHLYKTLH